MSGSAGMKRLVRAVLPVRLVAAVERRFFRVRWTGDYATWADAKAASVGYAAPTILAKVTEAARSARDGRAAYERDGVTFAEPAPNEPLLACLRAAATAAAARGEKLTVLDFGGALGSIYWQHRPWLKEIGSVTWRVVEQPEFVAVGRREFANGELSFFETIGAACAERSPDVALFSSVLPYVEDPAATLAEVAARGVRWIVIDRTGMVDGERDRITVQSVPRNLCPASYPCRFFGRERLLAPLAADYVVRAEWATGDGHASGFNFRGCVLERRTR